MRTPLILTAAALTALSLSACGQGAPETVDTAAPDPMASALRNAAPVELPPAVEASVTFRCQPGNKLAYVDFFQGRKQANFRLEPGGPATQLTAANAGEPLIGEGIIVTGDPKAITLVQPGQGTSTCKA